MLRTLISLLRRFFSHKKLVAVLVGIVIIIIAVGKISTLLKSRSAEKTEVKKGTVSEELILSGEVKADKFAQLNFLTNGELSWVGATEGEQVYKGEALASLNRVKLSADLQRARSDLRSAEATLAEVYDEVKGHSGDETFAQRETRTTAEVAKDKAYDAVTKAEEDLRNATLYAPFTGTISYVANSAPGVNIFYNQPQFELVDPSTIYFEVTADQTEVILLTQKQKVRIVLDSYPDENIEGEISYIALTPKLDEVGTNYKVRIGFIKPDDLHKVRVGMTGDANVLISQKEDVLYAPSTYIKVDTKGKYVLLGSIKNKVYIETGLEGEDRIEIKNKLKEGDTLYD